MVSKNELKSIKSLKVKKYRLREKRFLVEGAKNVLELVRSSYETDLILCTQQFNEAYNYELEKKRVEIVGEKMLNEVGTFKTNDACIAVACAMEHRLEEFDFEKQIFVLDHISDPGNFGTIIRTLDWFGFDQLVCSVNSAEFYNPKVIHSTMGSFTRVKVCYADLGNFLGACELPKYGAEMNGLNLFETKLDIPSIVVMGSESHGISNGVRSRLDVSISVPKYGKAESLNVAIATGVIAGYLRMS